MSVTYNPSIAIIQIGVIDPVASRHFYGNVLGLTESTKSDPSHPVFDLGHGQILLLYPASPGAVPPAYPDGLGVIPVFAVADIAGCIARLKAAHVEMISAPWADPDTGIANCPFGAFIGARDPSGNAIELLQRIARAE